MKRYEGGGNTVTYTYDDTGLRTSKTVNGAKSEYLYVGGQLLGEVRDGHHVHYSYDSFGNLSVIKYYTSDTAYYVYYVVTNAQGDVVSLHDANGAVKVAYEYDAWGNVVSMTDTTGIGIGTINPFRYRGYYYDAETGLYYLTSRYYDPEVGRFINADGYASTGQGVLGNNSFAYCNNNPVMRIDPSGEFFEEFWAAFTEAVQQASGYFAAAAGVSQVDSFMPGLCDIIAGVMVMGGLAYCTGVAISDVITASSSSISIPKAEEKEATQSNPPRSDGTTYYHVTTPENAAKIKNTNTLIGSSWESGYVFAWKSKPNEYAIKNSGAHLVTIISFKTNASFIMDTGIEDPKVKKYGPVVSAAPGPIVVWDVQIVG